MENIFTDYPGVVWKADWAFRSSPADRTVFVTGAASGSVTMRGASWTLHVMPPAVSSGARFLSNGFSVRPRRRHKEIVELLAVAPGVISGRTANPFEPQLKAPDLKTGMDDAVWVENNKIITLLLCRDDRFALVHGEWSPDIAFGKAVAAVEEKFHLRIAVETWKRAPVAKTFSVSLQYNPPAALAAEAFFTRLRPRAGILSGMWSVTDGFDTETFSLNELYPLVNAWNIIDPAIALELVTTALALQQAGGGFPAWVEKSGRTSTAAAWPLIARAFELAWKNSGEKTLLRKTLPALRKYIQWALLYFDPHRDSLPAWQNELEAFIPDSYERNKATPELTVMLITEIEVILRLCAENDQVEPVVETLETERANLIKTLNTAFWNPDTKSFSNAWRNGHRLTEITFGSFMPLFWQELDVEKRQAVLRACEESHVIPGQPETSGRKYDRLLDAMRMPSIHQFFALAALQQSNAARGMRLAFINTARESFVTWFETEIKKNSGGNESPYLPGPVTSALILAVQDEFRHEAERAPVINRQVQKIGRRFKLDVSDLKFFIILAFLIIGVRMIYSINRNRNKSVNVTEAMLCYRHGRYTEALQIAQRHPDHPVAQFLQANLLMISERADEAEQLYLKALKKNMDSPSALFGLALAHQMSGKFDAAVKRYTNFIDLYSADYSEAAALAEEYLDLALEHFDKPPGWRRVFSLAMMNDF